MRGSRRFSILVLTDGDDTASASTPSEVTVAATSASVAVYAVALGSSANLAILGDIASGTGGSLADVTDGFALSTLFYGIGAAVTSGRVVAHGTGAFDPPIAAAGLYRVSGALLTGLGAASVTTSFSFAVDLM